jgi:hypothetical protein
MSAVTYIKVSGTWELVGVDGKKVHAKIGGSWNDMSSGSNEIHVKDSSSWINVFPYNLDTWTSYETGELRSQKATTPPIYSTDPDYSSFHITTASEPFGWHDRASPGIGQQMGVRSFGWSEDIPGVGYGVVDRVRQTFEAKYIDAPEPGSNMKIHSGFISNSGKLTPVLTSGYVVITHDYTVSSWNMSGAAVGDLYDGTHEALVAGYYDNASDPADETSIAKSFQVGLHYIHN